MSERAQRVVSLVPSWTETMFELGRGAALVGCTRYCVEPTAELAAVARIGGTKNPAREAIAALDPDLVLADTEENRAEDIAWLRQRFEVFEAMPRTVADAVQLVHDLGRRLGATARAGEIAAAIEAAAQGPAGAPVRVLYPIWPKPWMSVNHDTYIHDVLAHAGATNVCGGRSERYPELALEDIADLGVDVVLLPDEPWEFTAAQRDDLARGGVFGGATLRLCCGKDVCWHGARTARGLAATRALLRSLR